MINYLEPEEILIIHARIISEIGGSQGVRDLNQIASMIERPKLQFSGRDLYPTIFDKAAAYFESCAYHHSFIDGNKRAAAALVSRFLHLNGFELRVTNEKLEKFVLSAVIKKYNLSKISAWIKKHSIVRV
ncbi:MAG: type II toxin-antitoxin system death-on-curing family toxin [Candidatus Vogelbacteria bacterium]|nr:type II toxin-antitoxin system death-on-curing family toxin [Candidatus Vogelbacteria bacterium]